MSENIFSSRCKLKHIKNKIYTIKKTVKFSKSK